MKTMKRPVLLQIPATALLVFALLAGGGCSMPPGEPVGVEAHPVEFSPREESLIRDFYRDYEWPPGVTRPSLLAPSLEAHLQRSAQLPPGTAAIPLPAELEEKLSPLPPGYERMQVGSDVILMDVRIREVIDMLEDVIR